MPRPKAALSWEACRECILELLYVHAALAKLGSPSLARVSWWQWGVGEGKKQATRICQKPEKKEEDKAEEGEK